MFSSRSKYEPIEPVPRRGQKKLLNYTLIGLGVAAVFTIGVVLIVHTSPVVTTPDLVDPVVPNANVNDTIPVTLTPFSETNGTANQGTDTGALQKRPVLGASAPYVLQAEEPNQSPKEDLLVTLNSGQIRGTYLKSRAGRDVLAFLGVPYAQPPVGQLRFALPVEAEPWDGILNTTELKPDCIQRDKYNPEFVTKGSEDCLYLNIYTPKNYSDLGKRRNRFPVMFYIHGGGQFGSGTRYHSDYFMDEDVLLITVHYRLGVWGNLNTNDSEARGNQGMKDQVMALQWVQNNIAKFGGDKNKVTIFGNSYGGMEVTAHLMSPMSKGLIQRAIVQSGTMIIPDQFPRNAIDVAYDLAEKMNCSSSTGAAEDLSTKDLVACLKNIDAVNLTLSSFLMEFQISVEPPADDGNVFLGDTPLNTLMAGNLESMPVIFGTVSGEGLFQALPLLANETSIKFMNENWETFAIEALQLKQASDPKRIANGAKEFYFGSKHIDKSVQPNLTDMFSDRRFVHPTYVFATHQLAANTRRDHVYLYYFDKDADKTYAQPALDIYGNNSTDFLGAGHADELQFLFPYEPYPEVPEGSKNANFSKMLVRLWTTFADTGKPSGADNGAEWLAIEDPKPYQWFLIDDEPEMVDFVSQRMTFWDQFNLTDLYYMKD